jgi:hypothetical protein
MIRANYFHNGYSQGGYLAAAPLMHGSLRFTYRPAMVEERSQLSDAARQLKSYLYDRQAALFTARKIELWDLTDEGGREVPISAVKLHRIVMGWIASDVDPAWPQETQDRALDLEIE